MAEQLTDWTCSACDTVNYGIRGRCRHCKTSRANSDRLAERKAAYLEGWTDGCDVGRARMSGDRVHSEAAWNRESIKDWLDSDIRRKPLA